MSLRAGLDTSAPDELLREIAAFIAQRLMELDGSSELTAAARPAPS